MNILIVDEMHPKNKIGLILMLNYLNYNYKLCKGNEIDKYINDYDIVYNCWQPYNIAIYPNKKFIFGPAFSVFPNNKLLQIKNIHKNSIYIQPSDWVRISWVNMNGEKYLPIKVMPFSVEIDKFQPLENIERDEVFIYFKRRRPEELQFIQQFLDKKNIHYKIFDYVKGYDEKNYLDCLQKAKYGIIVDAHESQGFAIEEALSCNVPLIVWNARFMSQEYGSKYGNISCSNIAYWDERCGEYFYNIKDFEETYDKFISKIETYKPREYIVENLSPKKCGERFIELINSF